MEGSPRYSVKFKKKKNPEKYFAILPLAYENIKKYKNTYIHKQLCIAYVRMLM